MASAIDATKPIDGVPAEKTDLRANLAAAKSEIEALQAGTGLANDAVTLAKIQNAAASSKLLGSGSAGAGANYTEITLDSTLTMTGTTLAAVPGAVADNSITNLKLRDSGALSVIGRSANSTGDPADIAASAASGAVLRESGSALGFGTIATAGIADGAMTYAKMQDVSAASRLVGRGSAAGAGDPQEISLGTNLSMSGTTLNATGGGSIAVQDDGVEEVATATTFNFSGDGVSVTPSGNTATIVIPGGAAGSGFSEHDETGATVAVDDAYIGSGNQEALIRCNSASAQTVSLGVVTVGKGVHIWQKGAGAVTVEAATDCEVVKRATGSLSTTEQHDQIVARAMEDIPGGSLTVVGTTIAESTVLGNSIQVGVPAGGSDGDLLVAWVTNGRGEANPIQDLAGWTNVIPTGSDVLIGASMYHARLFYKVAAGGEPNPYTFTNTGTTACWTASITRIANPHGTTPINVAAATVSGPTDIVINPSVITTVPNALVLLLSAIDGSAQPLGGVEDTRYPAGTVGVYHRFVNIGGVSDDWIAAGMAYFVQASAGATGDQTWDNLAAADNWAAVTVAIAPALSAAGSRWLIA